jgi:hypothetical protein
MNRLSQISRTSSFTSAITLPVLQFSGSSPYSSALICSNNPNFIEISACASQLAISVSYSLHAYFFQLQTLPMFIVPSVIWYLRLFHHECKPTWLQVRNNTSALLIFCWDAPISYAHDRLAVDTAIRSTNFCVAWVKIISSGISRTLSSNTWASCQWRTRPTPYLFYQARQDL